MRYLTYLISTCVALSGGGQLLAQEQAAHSHGGHGGHAGHGHAAVAPADARPAPKAVLLEDLGSYRFPVSTASAEAQTFFDQGMVLVYGFNHDEALISFRRAAELDPKLAMAHWGMALALGPNYNMDVDAVREKQAFEHITRARELAKDAPQHERDYIDALAKRFSGAENPDLKKLAADYAGAMRELSKKYPDDLDAATLFADAMMCLKPWMLYTKQNEPVEGTEEIVGALESVLKRNPDHIGACHLYIHAVEASKHPERALEAAARLPVMAPGAGHLVHMPSHIYARLGDYESAVTSNEAAVDVDRKYFAKLPDRKQGMYWGMYYPHNIHFIAYAHAYQGNFAGASKAAQQLYAHAQPDVAAMPMLEGFTVVPGQILAKFGKWDQILAAERPDEKTMPLTAAIDHFARGMAHAARGDFSAARAERAAIEAIRTKLPADHMYGMLNKSHHVLGIAELHLDASIARRQKQYDRAAELLRKAVEQEDDLTYMEPPDWLLPNREALGATLLEAGQYVEAEKVFRHDLDRTPRGPRSLLGLIQSLKAQGRQHEAKLVEPQFKAAWRNADTELKASDL